MFRKLERLRSEWGTLLSDAWKNLYENGEEHYLELCGEFERSFGYESSVRGEWERMGEQLMVFFVYTYFCTMMLSIPRWLWLYFPRNGFRNLLCWYG